MSLACVVYHVVYPVVSMFVSVYCVPGVLSMLLVCVVYRVLLACH